MPQVPHLMHVDQNRVADLGRMDTPLGDLLEVPFQMRPAELAADCGDPRIGTRSVIHHPPLEALTEKLLGYRASSAESDDEHAHERRSRHPHPSSLAGLLVPRLVRVHNRLLLDERLGLLHRGCKGLTDALFVLRYRSE